MDRRAEMGQPHTTGAALITSAFGHHLVADTQQLVDELVALFAVSQSARVAVVQDQRALAEVLAVHYPADVSAVAHRHHRQRDDGQVSQTTDIYDPALGFQRLKGFFILDYDCILTRHQVVDVLGQHLLVDFEDDGLINYRTVSFWHAFLKDKYLNIIAYDIRNKTIIT